jgi:hypothetical protein
MAAIFYRIVIAVSAFSFVAALFDKASERDTHRADFLTGCLLRGHLELTENTPTANQDKRVVGRKDEGRRMMKRVEG